MSLYEKHSIGENVEGKIEITSEDVFPKVITRQAIHEGDFGKTCVYYIKRQKGAWGYENILEEKAVTCFPNRNSDFVVLLSEVDEPMVVSTSELTNGERVKLTGKEYSLTTGTFRGEAVSLCSMHVPIYTGFKTHYHPNNAS